MRNKTKNELLEEIEALRARLEDEQACLRAIRNGEIDALVVTGVSGEQVFTLEEANKPYRIIIEEMSEGTVTTNDSGIILYSNKQFSKMLGVSLSRLIGSSLYEYVAPEHREAMQGVMTRDRAKTGKAEVGFQGKNGETIWAEVSFSPLQIEGASAFCGVITDITSQKNTRKALQESEERFRTSVETMIDAFTILTAIADGPGAVADFRIEYANASGLRLFHGNHEDLYGRTLLQLFSSLRDTALFEALRQVMETGRPMTRESVLIEGGPGMDEQPARYYDIQAVKFLQGLAVTWRDATERMRSEEEKRTLESQLAQTQRIEALDRFAGGIAHDLNNILYPVLINVEELLAEAPVDSSRREILDQTMKAVLRQRDLVKKILSFGRRSEEKLSPIHVAPLVEEALDFLRSTLPSTMEIKRQLDARTDMTLGDSTQIQQIVMNLVQNAVDAFESGKGTVEVSLGTTRRKPDRANAEMEAVDCLELTVKDSGSGMDPHVLDHVFEPFYTTKEPGRGSGLGLPVVHGIVKRLGGTISARSRPMEGTTFTVLLPVYTGEVQDQAASFESGPPEKYQGKILLVDDDETILSSLQRVLRHSGYRVVAVKDSVEAFRMFEREPYGYDLLITDLTMPKMTGIELARKALGIRPGVPVVLCTGFNDVINEREARSLGIRELLMKPAGSRELKETIQRALEH